MPKIELAPPYSEHWDIGYTFVQKGRKKVKLYGDGKLRSTTVNYARYLYEVKLGDYLPKDITVDHKDDDKANDRLRNLQLLTNSDNVAKENRRRAKA